MHNYNMLNSQIQINYQNYFYSLCIGMKVPDSKFIFQSLSGILKSNSCHLTKISRKLNESIKLKKTVERLSNNFMNFNDQNTIKTNYINQLKESKLIGEDPLFIVDDSDISKPLSKHLEALDIIPDGSNQHRPTLGYWLTEIVALSNNKTPISTYSNLWSSKEEGFVSKNKILYNALDENIKNFGKNGTYVFDRYFDSNELFKFMISNNTNFIVRLKNNRNVIINNKKQNIKDLNYKGKINLTRKSQKGTYYNKLTYTNVKLPGLINHNLTLLLVFSQINQEPLLIITNRTVNNAHDARQVASDYLSRWRIEEYFKFKKQEFKIEDVRVRSLNGLKLMNQLVTYVITFLAPYTDNKTYIAKKIFEISNSIKKEVYFNYYRVIYGIRDIINKFIVKVSDYIDQFIRNSKYILKKRKEINLFNYKYIK